jgi:membrane-bound serine protease (ClpP class)
MAQPAPPEGPPSPVPVVVAAEYDGIIHPIAAEFLDGLIRRAEERGAVAVVLTLRTPGGLLDSTRTMTSRMIAAGPPVIVYIGPSGSRAASAGFLITLAADVAAMAPGTSIGAAHPVSGEGAPDRWPRSAVATSSSPSRRCSRAGRSPTRRRARPTRR